MASGVRWTQVKERAGRQELKTLVLISNEPKEPNLNHRNMM